MPEAKLSDKLRNTEWNDDEYAMMELRHWYALCDEVAALESDVRVAYGKMNVLIQREKARDKLVAALEATLDDYEQTLRIIMFATTLPPMVLNDNEGFYRRELQRCIGDTARVLHKHKQESPDD